MMGHDEPTKSNLERWAFAPETKQHAGRRSGVRAKIKARFNRRCRRAVAMELAEYSGADAQQVLFDELGEVKPRGWWTG